MKLSCHDRITALLISERYVNLQIEKLMTWNIINLHRMKKQGGKKRKKEESRGMRKNTSWTAEHINGIY